MSVECGQIHSPGLVCVSFLSLLLLAQGQAKPSKVSVQGGVSILWVPLMKEARDREAISRGGGQVPLRARLAHRLHLSCGHSQQLAVGCAHWIWRWWSHLRRIRRCSSKRGHFLGQPLHLLQPSASPGTQACSDLGDVSSPDCTEPLDEGRPFKF